MDQPRIAFAHLVTGVVLAAMAVLACGLHQVDGADGIAFAVTATLGAQIIALVDVARRNAEHRDVDADA